MNKRYRAPNLSIYQKDPRQFVPPTGQSWTSLRQVRPKHRNIFTPDSVEPRMTSIHTEPKFGIGQRCILLETPAGNVLWDCIAYLDEETVEFINKKGGLKAIVISHPHYYTTHLDWARTFGCPVYVAKEDEEWLSRKDGEGSRRFIEAGTEEVLAGVVAIKVSTSLSSFELYCIDEDSRPAAIFRAVWFCSGTRSCSLLILWLLCP